MKKKRVIAWGVGYLGRRGLRRIIDDPALDLVGLHVWSPEKIGKDAGELAGKSPTGIIATRDTDSLLALRADALAYFADTSFREAEAIAEIVPFLMAGTNVVSVSHFDLQYPRFGDPGLVEPVREACSAGGSSFLLTGEEPGFAFGQHLFALLGTMGRVDSIRLCELSNVQQYGGAQPLRMYGFNGPTDVLPPMYTEKIGAAWHIATLQGIVDFLGLEIERIEQRWESAAVDFPVETAAFDTVEPGRAVAARWTVEAWVGGQPFLTYRKLLRLHADAAPEWERQMLPGEPGVTDQIQIDGDIGFREELHRPKRGISASPVLAVNTIPFVCDARPGILLQHDIPAIAPRSFGVFSSERTAKAGRR